MSWATYSRPCEGEEGLNPIEEVARPEKVGRLEKAEPVQLKGRELKIGLPEKSSSELDGRDLADKTPKDSSRPEAVWETSHHELKKGISLEVKEVDAPELKRKGPEFFQALTEGSATPPPKPRPRRISRSIASLMSTRSESKILNSPRSEKAGGSLRSNRREVVSPLLSPLQQSEYVLSPMSPPEAVLTGQSFLFD